MQALQDLNVPPDAVVLTNAYTEGFVQQVMGAEGLLEGRAPYTFPRALVRANALLREAAAFYEHPCENRRFLNENKVDYVLVSERHSYSLGTGNVFELRVRHQTLAACPALHLVLSEPGLKVYRLRR
jgi:hypothetical protein